MKKRIAISILLCAFLLVGTVGAVSAKSASFDTASPDPQVTLVSGNSKFHVKLISIQDLPGVAELSSGMLVPAGFSAGEKQFEGKGVQISGLTYGSVKACFSVIAVGQGWGGKVAKWNGSKWELLSTAISAQEDSPYSLACATVSANGTYAFVNWVVDPSKLPTNSGVCNFGIDYKFNTNYGYGFGPYMGIDVPANITNGTPVTYKIISIDSSYGGTLTSGLTGSTTVQDYISHAALFNDSAVSFSEEPYPNYVARFTFPTLKCHIDLEYQGSFLSEMGG